MLQVFVRIGWCRPGDLRVTEGRQLSAALFYMFCDKQNRKGVPVKRKDRRESKVCGVLSLDLESLSAALGCGKATAAEVGAASGARFRIGRRVLYSTDKVREYISSLCSE